MTDRPARPERQPSAFERWLRLAFVRVEDRRLTAALAVARRELIAAVYALGAADRRATVGATVAELLDDADAARARGRVDEGWQCLEAARRLAVFAATDEEAIAIAGALRAEAEAKLPGWRRAAILAQLRPFRPADRMPLTVDRYALHTAMRLRDEHHQNQYYRTRLVARQFKTIALYLGVALVGMLLVHRLGGPFPGSVAGASAAAPQMLPWMALFGLLGATFSVAFPLTSGGDGRRIPEHVGGQAITLIRPLLGAAAGPVAYAFARSGLFSSAIAGDNALLLVAFAAGFSERLILRAVGSVGGDEPAVRVETVPATSTPAPPRSVTDGEVPVLGADASIVVPTVSGDRGQPAAVTTAVATVGPIDVSPTAGP